MGAANGKYAVETKISEAPKVGGWMLLNARTTASGAEVTLHVARETSAAHAEASASGTAPQSALELSFGSSRFLKVLRHPQILRYIDGDTVPTTARSLAPQDKVITSGSSPAQELVLVTERVVPLRECVAALSRAECALGLRHVVEALIFLHENNISHNNVCMDSVYVLSSSEKEDGTALDRCSGLAFASEASLRGRLNGDWKLGGMEFAWEIDDERWDETLRRWERSGRLSSSVVPPCCSNGERGDGWHGGARDVHAVLGLARDLGLTDVVAALSWESSLEDVARVLEQDSETLLLTRVWTSAVAASTSAGAHRSAAFERGIVAAECLHGNELDRASAYLTARPLWADLVLLPHLRRLCRAGVEDARRAVRERESASNDDRAASRFVQTLCLLCSSRDRDIIVPFLMTADVWVPAVSENSVRLTCMPLAEVATGDTNATVARAGVHALDAIASKLFSRAAVTAGRDRTQRRVPESAPRLAYAMGRVAWRSSFPHHVRARACAALVRLAARLVDTVPLLTPGVPGYGDPSIPPPDGILLARSCMLWATDSLNHGNIELALAVLDKVVESVETASISGTADVAAGVLLPAVAAAASHPDRQVRRASIAAAKRLCSALESWSADETSIEPRSAGAPPSEAFAELQRAEFPAPVLRGAPQGELSP